MAEPVTATFGANLPIGSHTIGVRAEDAAALVEATAAYGTAVEAAVEHAAATTACAVVDAEIAATRRRRFACVGRWRTQHRRDGDDCQHPGHRRGS